MRTEAPIAPGGAPIRGLQSIEVALISAHPDQPRRHFDEDALNELAESIGRRGVIQPIVVRPLGQRYQIVAGERRWRAAQRARLHQIPAIVRDFDDTETLEIALVENIQREDLNAIEEAQTYSRLISDYGHSQDALAKIVGKSRSHIANLLRLLDLPDGVQQAVIDKRLTMGHARALIGAGDSEALADRVAEQGLSVRETERLARSAKQREGRGGGNGRADRHDPDIAALERRLSDLVGLPVSIGHREDGKGTLSLTYSSLDQLDMLCQRLTGERI